MPATGPLFDGRAKRALADYTDWADHQVGRQAMADWHLELDRSLQYPTGRYESTIHLSDDPFGSVVHDTGMIYNYWLEGHGSRNAPVTRFRGYHAAQRGAEMARARAKSMVDPIPERFMAAMGGGR